ncbi:MAG TPA: transketolase C-terminal domain-containing protein [Candidatus Paceibacterota bacterium]|jgi:transketolase|nr:transketolase C-terminal domain-containing protein [Candidatus Paceibacterota bacterium]
MLNPEMKLREDLFDAKEQKPTRDGFGAGLVEAAEADPRIVALCADLTESTRMEEFKKRFPERFVEIGVAEQNLATVASGMAAFGKIPFITSYATFSPGRNNEQIRTTISINQVPVKIVGSHAGISVGPDGATHQALEDIALMRVQPNMTVVSPCDAEEARKATLAVAKTNSPAYIRLGREKTPLMTTVETPFEFGKANVVWRSDAPQVALFATGPLLFNALCAGRDLEKGGIQATVINVHTIKPLDEETIVAEAKKAGAVVTVEEHQIAGGLGSAIAELLAQKNPVPIEFIGVRDRFGQSGTPAELMEEYGLGVSYIMEAVKKIVGRK